MPADLIHDTVWAQELLDEGHAKGLAESAHVNTVKNLEYRGVGGRHAELIAVALLEADSGTSVQRAAFDDLEQLKALVEQND